jgi:exosortase A
VRGSTRSGRLLDTRQASLAYLLLVALGLVIWAYFPTFYSIVEKWDSDATFSHGFLIVPVSLWLAWRLRWELAGVPFRPSVWGIAALAGCVLAWIVARGAGVLVLEQFAAVAMIPSLVLAALGWPATRVLLVPLGFLFFAVPFGRGLVPYLMQATAYVAALLVEWTGIPILRSHMYLTIPYGQFEVARACSGLNYFITSLVLGVLYAYLNYRGWKKRLLCVAAFLVFPVVLNILRVYVIVVVSYLTEFRFGPGTEHVVFGRVFFLIVILALFWIGRRWHDDMPMPAARGAAARADSAAWTRWWPLPLATLLALAGPPFLETSIARSREHLANASLLVKLPEALPGWQGPDEATGRWRPHYVGGVTERQAMFRDDQGGTVDVFVAVYGLGAAHGAEMISYGNVVSLSERGSLASDGRRTVALSHGESLEVRELVLHEGETPRLVWQWYVVGERPVVGPYATKAFEALAFITRSAASERVVTVSTPLSDGAERRLEAFVTSRGRCVAEGFPVEACGG